MLLPSTLALTLAATALASPLSNHSTDDAFLPARAHARRAPHPLPLPLPAHNAPGTHELHARAPPSGWQLYVASGNDGGGCYADTNPRVLSGWIGRASGGSSVEKAINECKSRGFSWAGVQFGDEIYCGSSQPANLQSASSGDCNSRCASGETCGGGWRMNIYTTIPQGGSWAHQGCYRDATDRALKGHSFYDGQMSLDKCRTQCQSRGFSMAGVEYSAECYCGNSNSAPKIADSECNMRCPSGESNCGGAYAFNLYTFTARGSANTLPDGWRALHCATDDSRRALTGAVTNTGDMTVRKCVDFCATRSFAIAGLQAGGECYCGNVFSRDGLAAGAGRQVDAGQCNRPCTGGVGTCGGDWRLSLYTTLDGAKLTEALAGGPSASPSPSPSPTPTPTPAPAPTQNSPTSYTPPQTFGGGGEKQIYAHHMIGNTYPYGREDWRRDISEAKSAGIDGFFLNIGLNDWQPARVRDAYDEAAAQGFKMALSFDMYEIGCGGNQYVGLLRTYLQTFLFHSAAAKYRSRSIVSTFAGESCSFGSGNTNSGWGSVFAGWRNNVWFSPAYNADPMSLPGFDIDGMCNWGSAWPDYGKEIETSRDSWFMQQLGSKGYMATISPLFATHLPYKNWVWRGDNMLLSNRWEQLLGMRDRIDQVQVVSWNDYGEATYLSNIRGDMPPEARAYANEDFRHSDLLSLQAFYSFAWKNGRYPAITRDQIWIMGRPHPVWAGASADPYGAPRNRELATDNFYAQLHLVAESRVTTCSGNGNGCNTRQAGPGIVRVSGALVPGQKPVVRVERGGQVTTSVEGQTFDGNPARYNFKDPTARTKADPADYWIKSS